MLFCLSFSGCSGCNLQNSFSQSDSQPRVEHEVEAPSIALDKTSLMLTIGDEERLTPILAGEAGTVHYVSNDISIATVDEYGLISAISEGSTVIIASYGDATHTCEVTVTLGGMRPSLELMQIEATCAKVAICDVLSLESQIQFNGKYFQDLQVEYTISDPTVGVVTQGNVFQPLKAGETSVLISATWRGIHDKVSMTKEITIKVQNDVALYVNDGATEYILYTLDQLQGKSYTNRIDFQAKVTVNGERVEAGIRIKEGEDVISFDGETVTALQYGKAILNIFYQDQLDLYEKDIIINVLRPIGIYNDTVKNFSALDGELPISEIFGEEVTLVGAEQNGKKLTVIDNNIFGVETRREGLTNTKVLLYTADKGYEVPLVACTKIIDGPEDLAVLAATQDNPTIDGYFYLANDIVSETEENLHTAYWPNTADKTVYEAYGFKGIFEGNGYVIDYHFNEVGLFGNLLDGAIVRNVALIATRNQENLTTLTPCILAHRSGANVKVENVYARATNNVINSARNVVFIGTRSTSLELNCVIVENHTMLETKNGGILFYADASRKTTALQNRVNNVYAISSYPFITRWESKKCIYANNDEPDSIYTTEQGTITNYTGVTRYDTYEAMMGASGVYKDFNQNYWNLSLGIPIWKGLFVDYAEKALVQLGETDTSIGETTLERGFSQEISVLVLGKEIPYVCEIVSGGEYVSYADGKLTAVAQGEATINVSYVLDGVSYEKIFVLIATLPTETYSKAVEFSAMDGALPLTEIFGEEVTLLKAYQGTNALTISNNKIFGLNTRRDGVTDTQITLFTEEKGVSVKLNAYTRILDESSDFKIFDLTENKIVDGYYYLKNDVELTEAYSHLAYWTKASGKLTFETNVGFNGVFEGNGHTVTYSFREWGLFGQMLDGAVIQNVHFVATRTTTNCNIATHNGALARSSYGGKVKNVYIQINDSVYNKDRNSSLIGCRYLDKNDYGTTQLIDVIVVATDSNDSYRGGVVFDTDSARNAQTYDNEGSIYVISTNKYMANWAPATPSSSVTASNDTVSGCSVSYSKITRYDRVEALENVEQIGNWVVSNGVISWQD